MFLESTPLFFIVLGFFIFTIKECESCFFFVTSPCFLVSAAVTPRILPYPFSSLVSSFSLSTSLFLQPGVESVCAHI